MIASSPKTTVIFTTSEISRTYRLQGKADTPESAVSTLPDGSPVWSTGRLEAALANNMTVFVVTTRHKLGPHDQWWRALLEREAMSPLRVGSPRIFKADDYTATEEWAADGIAEHVQDAAACLSRGWHSLFDFLGHEWPTCEVTGNPSHWTEARYTLRNRGYTLGSDIRP